MCRCLGEWYMWLKVVHIFFIIAWMAGLLYLPRIFVYHTEVGKGSETYKIFLTMERRLLKGIMLPSAVLSVVSGILLAMVPGIWQKGEHWLHAKISLVIFLIIGHGLMVHWYNQFKQQKSQLTGRFFRLINEIPALLLIGIIILVILKPF